MSSSTRKCYRIGRVRILSNRQAHARRSRPRLEPLELRALLADVGDTLATAEITGLGPGVGRYNRSFEQLGDGPVANRDIDLYRIEATTGQTLLVTTSRPSSPKPPSNTDTYLRLFNASGTQLAFNDDGGPDFGSQLSFSITTTGTYYIGISGYGNSTYNPVTGVSTANGSTGPYQIFMSLTAPPTPAADLAGDTIGTALATGLSVPGTYSNTSDIGDGVYGLQDVDMYAVTLTAGGRLTATTSQPSGFPAMDTVLRIFNSAGTQISGGLNDDITPGTNLYSTLTFTTPTPGTFYVAVSGFENLEYTATSFSTANRYGGTTGRYTLTLVTEQGAPPPPDIGETIPTAFNTGQGPGGFNFTRVERIGDGPNTNADVDMYQFQANAGATITAETSQPTGGTSMDTYIRLFNASGTQLAFDDDAGPGLYSLLSYRFTTAGMYYLGVSGYINSSYNPITGTGVVPGSTGDYQIRLTLVEPATATGLAYHDLNRNGSADSGEPGLSNWVVYNDANNNGNLDDNEPFTFTDLNGNYTLPGLPAGVVANIRVSLPRGWVQTSPNREGIPIGGGFIGLGVAPDPLVIDPELPEPGADKTNYDRPYTQTEVLAQVLGDDPIATLTAELNASELVDAMGLIDLNSARVLFWSPEGSIVQVGLPQASDVLSSISLLESLGSVIFAAPNLTYSEDAQDPTKGDPREFTPNDPQYSSQYHHPLMQNNLAWDLTLGSPNVVVAVTDDGVALNHPDLRDNIWVNPGEVAGNGIDDDGNGFIDDVNGWDFSSNDNNPNPLGSDSHGTHVAGIIAARTNNAVGVAGTAGGARIMPIRFYGSAAWTSAIIAASFGYATNNGAKIVNTSYNMDGFANDAVVNAAFTNMYNAGVLHFNSAGNNNQLNPPRQVFTQTLLVASTTNTDTKSSFSNYGTGVDVSAPGSDILSTLTSSGGTVFTYGLSSGTSMSTPNAAGVAALIWSQFPGYTRDQVAARLLATAVNIDAQNPAYVGLLGTGRVNSHRALTQAVAPPRLDVIGLPPEYGTLAGTLTSFSVDFLNVLDPASVVLANFDLRGDGADGIFGNADDNVITLAVTAGTPYRVGTNLWTFSVTGTFTPDRYRFTARSGSTGLRDPFGTQLDGNGDGVGGDAFTRTFFVGGPNTPNTVTPGSGQVVPNLNFGAYEETALANPMVRDNGGWGYWISGAGWTTGPGGYGGTHQTHTGNGTADNNARWVMGLMPGTYEVFVRWVSGANHATSARYGVWDGTTLRRTILVGQRLPSQGVYALNQLWQSLGVIQTSTYSLGVSLSSQANGMLSADAILVVPFQGSEGFAEPGAGGGEFAGVPLMLPPSDPFGKFDTVSFDWEWDAFDVALAKLVADDLFDLLGHLGPVGVRRGSRERPEAPKPIATDLSMELEDTWSPLLDRDA